MTDTFDPKQFLRETAPAPAPAAAPAEPAFDPKQFLRETQQSPGGTGGVYPTYRGGVLPFTKYSDGSVRFTPISAGPIGSLMDAFKLPGDVASGETKVDMNDPNFVGRVTNMAGNINPINPMVRSGDRAIPGVSMAAKDPSLAKVPTYQELLKSGGDKLDAFRDLPTRYNPAAFGTLGNQIEQDLLRHGVMPYNSKELYGFVRGLQRGNNAPEGVIVNNANLMGMRENLASLFGKPNEHQKGVGVAFDALNNFIEKPPQGAVLAGSPAFLDAYGPQLYAEGRGNYAAGMRAKSLEDIKRTADLRAQSAHSGANTDNSLRSRVTSAILDAQRTKGFTEAEKAALEAVPEGTRWNNTKRYIGNMFGGGGGIGAGVAATIGGNIARTMGAPEGLASGIGMAVPAIGSAFKRSAGIGTREALDEVINMTKRRSPLFRDSGMGDLVPNSVAGRDAMARTLMRMQAQGGQGVPLPIDQLPTYDPNQT